MGTRLGGISCWCQNPCLLCSDFVIDHVAIFLLVCRHVDAKSDHFFAVANLIFALHTKFRLPCHFSTYPCVLSPSKNESLVVFCDLPLSWQSRR